MDVVEEEEGVSAPEITLVKAAVVELEITVVKNEVVEPETAIDFFAITVVKPEAALKITVVKAAIEKTQNHSC